MKFKFTLLIIFLAFSVPGFSQLIKEGFEGATFPPAGWTTIDIQGASVWEQSPTAAFEGLNSAYIQYDGTAGEDWLIMPQFHVAATDSLSFWVLLDYAGFPPDSLCIKISTTGNNISDFTTTVLKLEEGVNYPVDNATWVRYSIPLVDYADDFVYIAFKHADEDGDGLFIDNVSLGTLPANDVAATSIDMDTYAAVGVPTTPLVTFTNVGTDPQTFNVTLSTPGYTSTKTVTALAGGGTTQQVAFNAWTPATTGAHLFTATATLAGDADPSNNVITATVAGAPGFENYGWISSTLLNSPRAAQGSTSYVTGPHGNDTTHLILISGGDDTFTPTTSVDNLNTRTGVWTALATVPTARLQAQAYYYNGKIFYIGGYTATVVSNEVSIYNVATNTWSAGTPIPVAVGDYAGCQFRDSLIYIIGGYNDIANADQDLVQIYNAKTNTWSSGTTFAGMPVEGGRAAISNYNKIIVVGGFSDVLGDVTDQSMEGTVDLSDYHNISWAPISAYPPGPIVRASAAGAVTANTIAGAGIAYFTGGDPDGMGTLVVNELWGYDALNSQWKLGPNKITAASNLQNFTEVIYKDSVYLASTGGYNGFGILDVNEWINLGKQFVIPLKLIQFTAGLRDAQAILKWDVSEDGLGGYYVIQKSKDGINFTDLRKVDAGRSDRTVSYQTPDELPYHGYTYYRLKIVNIDGNFTYSPVRSVLNTGTTDMQVSVTMYPNPAIGKVNLAVQSNNIQPTLFTVRISDISGKVIETNAYTMDNALSLSYNLKPGTYIVEVNSHDNNFRWSQKLVVF